jgi:hypothetical protein
MNEIRAFPITLLQTSEPLRAVRELAAKWDDKATILVWDILAGVRDYQEWTRGQNGRSGLKVGGDPLGALSALHEAQAPVILIALNYHVTFKNPPVIQGLLDGCRAWSRDTKRLVIVAPPGTSLPAEVERYVVVLDHDLPDEEALAALATANAEANGLSITDEAVAALARLGRGLTSYEFTNAIALSIAEHGEIRRDEVAEQKAQLVKKNAVLEWSRADWTFESVGGLDRVKAFIAAVAVNPLSRGVLFLGVPGVGKTMVAKALANEIGLPALQLQFSQVFGSLVGESEQKMHTALKVVEAMAPCVLIIDEIEKGLSGVSSSHRSDGGTAARVGESFLTWLNDRPAQGVFVVATCNDISKLPPEFIRAERWDAIWFFDLPTQAERDIIAGLYAEEYDIPLEPRPDEHGWTGAEIKTAYRIARMLGTDAAGAAQFVVPLYKTMKEQLTNLREWAQGRCVPASVDEKTSADVETVRTLEAW